MDDISKRGLATYFLNLKKLAKMPALMAFGLGDNADEVEKMPEAELKAILAKRLSILSKSQVSPNSFRIYRSSWMISRIL